MSIVDRPMVDIIVVNSQTEGGRKILHEWIDPPERAALRDARYVVGVAFTDDPAKTVVQAVDHIADVCVVVVEFTKMIQQAGGMAVLSGGFAPIRYRMCGMREEERSVIDAALDIHLNDAMAAVTVRGNA
jgi:hypothetical protein